MERTSNLVKNFVARLAGMLGARCEYPERLALGHRWPKSSGK